MLYLINIFLKKSLYVLKANFQTVLSKWYKEINFDAGLILKQSLSLLTLLFIVIFLLLTDDIVYVHLFVFKKQWEALFKFQVNPNIKFEVFIHKVDGLSDDHKIGKNRASISHLFLVTADSLYTDLALLIT